METERRSGRTRARDCAFDRRNRGTHVSRATDRVRLMVRLARLGSVLLDGDGERDGGGLERAEGG